MTGLYGFLLAAVQKSLNGWRKRNKNESLINIAQQLNLLAVELRKMSSALEEEYKKSL